MKKRLANILLIMLTICICGCSDTSEKSSTHRSNTSSRLEEKEREKEAFETEEGTIAQEETEIASEIETNICSEEIIFREIPWGTNYTEVFSQLQSMKLLNISGENYKTMSADEILFGDYKGLDFDFTDINVIAYALNGETEVAGYTTSEINLYFSYVPVDGVITKEENDTSLYGAQYIFESQNLTEMYADLTEKLISLYGEPAEVTTETDIYDNLYTYTHWYGQNDTEVVLKSVDATNDTTGYYKNEIYISYVWRYGDTMLQEASDILQKVEEEKEAEVYNNDDTNGL